MKYGSICSGIEAASVAFNPLGWEAAWFSEIDKFPCAVLDHHYPNTPNHGDMTTIRDRILNGEIEAPDMICGGPPCQSFSNAGLRNSLSDDRGNLTLEYIKICDATDHIRSTAGKGPAWILYENVPGLLNTHDNAFGAFLGGLCGRDAAIPQPADGWTGAGVVDGPSRCAAWRVLNAEHFGLAQRRKRVFVLARGGAGRWAAADALLPIIESSRWHPAPRRGTGEGVAADAGAGAEGCVDAIPINTQLGLRGDTSNTSREGIGIGNPGDPAFTLQAAHGHAVAFAQPPMLIRMREGKDGGGKGPLVSDDMSLTLATGNDQVLCAPTLTASNDPSRSPQSSEVTMQVEAVHAASMQVRRLTPAECEKLQGFPPGYTNIPWRGKPESPDGPRYKALGNSWAVPCARWIGERIKAIRP